MAEVLLATGIVVLAVIGSFVAFLAGSLMLIFGVLFTALLTALGAIIGVGFGNMSAGATLGGILGLAVSITLFYVYRRYERSQAAAIPSDS